MQMPIRILTIIVAIAITACQRQLTPTESKIVGSWSTPNTSDATDEGFTGTMEGFQLTTFKGDHTFSQDNHPNGKPVVHQCSGTWHADTDHLIMKFTSDPSGEMIGQQLDFVLSDLQRDHFVAANAPNQKLKVVFKRSQ